MRDIDGRSVTYNSSSALHCTLYLPGMIFPSVFCSVQICILVAFTSSSYKYFCGTVHISNIGEISQILKDDKGIGIFLSCQSVADAAAG